MQHAKLYCLAPVIHRGIFFAHVEENNYDDVQQTWKVRTRK